MVCSLRGEDALRESGWGRLSRSTELGLISDCCLHCVLSICHLEGDSLLSIMGSRVPWFSVRACLHACTCSECVMKE